MNLWALRRSHEALGNHQSKIDNQKLIDHDRLFKELVTTFFAEFVELFLPELSTYLDASSIEFLDKELFTDVTEGERHEADVVVRVRFQGKNSFFLLAP